MLVFCKCGCNHIDDILCFYICLWSVKQLNSIVKLWNEHSLPIKDGIYWADGGSIAMDIIAYPFPSVEKKETFSLDAFLQEHHDEITSIDIFKKIPLPTENKYVWIGEGSYGSEGFIALIDENDCLIWVMYAEESNPFVSIEECASGSILAISSLGLKLIIDIDNPQNVKLANV